VETWVAAKEIDVVQPILEGFEEDFQKLIRDYLAAEVEWSVESAAKHLLLHQLQASLAFHGEVGIHRPEGTHLKIPRNGCGIL
jgi:hypothetical protein